MDFNLDVFSFVVGVVATIVAYMIYMYGVDKGRKKS